MDRPSYLHTCVWDTEMGMAYCALIAASPPLCTYALSDMSGKPFHFGGLVSELRPYLTIHTGNVS